MTHYLLNRLIRGILSIVLVVAIVMILVYSLVDRKNIFLQDSVYSKQQGNEREVYAYRCWEDYGYLDYVPFTEYLAGRAEKGEITTEQQYAWAAIGYTPDDDPEEVAEAVALFVQTYEAKGYTVIRRNAELTGPNTLKKGGAQQLFAYKNTPLIVRLWKYFTHLITVDNIHYVKEDIANRGLSFTLFDPVYGGKRLSPAIIGTGTQHKYLLYMDNHFPFLHQNLINLNLGLSYSINTGVDVFTTMTQSQGSIVKSEITYPSGFVGEASFDLHSATYSAGTFTGGNPYYTTRFVDDYTSLSQVKASMSKTGFSFVIGVLAAVISYLLGIPIGLLMAQNKEKLIDKLGTLYIVFIIAVPSLAYIFMFRAIGKSMGIPTTFDIDSTNRLMFVLPILSLALPSVGGLMKWSRRYMIDQMNSDYVKFARSGGLSDHEIFSKHILKNAIIPIVHGIPGTILGAMVGAIITESVYSVPGAGGMIVKAINYYDNGAIIGLTLFYAALSVISLILGDILMALVDPRISFTSKAR